MVSYTFNSGFTLQMKKFIDFKVACGFHDYSYITNLRDFDKWCCLNYPSATKLDADIVLEYCKIRSNEKASSQSKRISTVRMLSSFIASTGQDTFLVPDNIGKMPEKHRPYIFTENEKIRFFKAVDSLEPTPVSPNKDLVLPVMFRLMYCCGLRPQEVRKIKLDDVHLHKASIFIRSSKNRKDRMIAVSEDMNDLLVRYISLMSIRQPHSTYLFERPEGGPYQKRWLSKCAYEIATKAGLELHGDTWFRAYDLRHNFATSVIVKWHRRHEDVDSKIVFLSEYMGHVELDDTIYYITLIPEMFMEWSQMDTAFIEKVIPETSREEDFWNE